MKTKLLLVLAMALSMACITTSLSAQNSHDEISGKTHPRKEQVNSRLKKQNARIDKKVAEGKMTKVEGQKLKRNDHAIRIEEKNMAKQNNGHITRQEQKVLNKQENVNSKKIRNQ